jgi:hypothetical protein
MEVPTMKANPVPTTDSGGTASSPVRLPTRKPPKPKLLARPHNLLQAIICAASDPSIDIAKVEHLVRLKKEMEAAEAERLFNDALAAAQAEMVPIVADAVNAEVGRAHRYASYAHLDRAVRPIYTAHGLSVTFNTGERSTDTAVEVTCYLCGHGYGRSYAIIMPADGKGARGGDVMSRTHAAASAISYGMRYLLVMIFNLAIDRDDDGNAAGRVVPGRISAEQVKRIKSLAAAVKADVRRFCAFLGVASIDAIPAARFEHAVAALAAKGSKSLAAGSAPPVKVPPKNSDRALSARRPSE